MNYATKKRLVMSGAFITVLVGVILLSQSTAFALTDGSYLMAAGVSGEVSGNLSSHCEDDSGRDVVACHSNRFASVKVFADGTYEIDWTEWDGENSDVEGYTVMRQRLLHRTFAGDVGQGEDLLNRTHFKPGSCVVGRSWDGTPGNPSQFVWRCSGVSNAYETPDGTPVTLEVLVMNSPSTEYTGSLEMRGQRTKDIDVIELPTPAPTSWDSVPNEVVVQQSVIETEIHLYYITVHHSDSTTSRQYSIADSANGFDPQN